MTTTTAANGTRASSGFPPWLGGVVLAVAVLATWWTSLPAPFELDDHSSILSNPTIVHLSSFQWVHPPATAGETVSGRPVLNLSFAIDYAVHGLHASGFRFTNLLIHAGAALALFGIARRALARAVEDEAARNGTAFALALIWALHPLQSGAVTYVVQRAESLAGLFSFLTLYGFVRATESNPIRSRWWVFAAIACWLGVLTKETVAVVPLVVLLYDRTFVSGGWAAAWRRHGRTHAVLFASWIPLALLVYANHGRGGSAGLDTAVTSSVYFFTQCEAIVRYLRLAFWPAGQVFDYGVPVDESLSSVWGQLMFLLVLGGVTVWLLIRNRPAGFLGACFFLLLAPSSSFIPVATQTIAEHRMYLALVPIVTLSVCGVRLLRLPRLARIGLATLATIALAAATVKRNEAYRSELLLWRDTVVKRPDNARAQHNLGRVLAELGEEEEAIAAFRRAIKLQPNHAFAHFSLGSLLAGRGDRDEALAHFRAAVEADAHYVNARINLGYLLMQRDRDAEARKQFDAALRDDPSAEDARTNLAALAIKQGRLTDADALLALVLQAQPDSAAARFQLGFLREKQGDGSAADREFRTAVRLDPKFAPAHLALGNLHARAGDPGGAETSLREAIRLAPNSAEARFAMGNLLAKQQHFDAAMAEFRTTLGLDPNHVQALNNLANCELVTRHFAEAVADYERVLRVRPSDAAVRQNLEIAREMLRGR